MEEKKTRGRPLKFKSPEEMQVKIDKWINDRLNNTVKVLTKSGDVVEIDKPLPLTVTSLAVALDTTRDTLITYSEKDEFFDTIKKAKALCLQDAEDRLYTNFTPGVIFSMKNNYGWTDKQEVDQTISNKDDKVFQINIKVID